MGAYQMWAHDHHGLGVASSSQIISSIRKGHTMDFTDMTPEEILELIEAAEKEVAARQNRKALETEINDVLLRARSNDAAKTPDREWSSTPHIDESFALGETTVLDGVTYESKIPNN